jgi:hypothetical protein
MSTPDTFTMLIGNPMPESTLSSSEGLWIWPLYSRPGLRNGGVGLDPIIAKRRNRHFYFVYKSCAIVRSDDEKSVISAMFSSVLQTLCESKEIVMEKRKKICLHEHNFQISCFLFCYGSFFCSSKKTPAISPIEITSLIIKNTINVKRRTCLHQLVLVLLQDRSGLILKALIIKHNFYEVLGFLLCKHLCQCSQIATMHA